tara:strand:+ start:497 stop:835 length:339 start_codon:yes stop_codon:yes gene_type:complete
MKMVGMAVLAVVRPMTEQKVLVIHLQLLPRKVMMVAARRRAIKGRVVAAAQVRQGYAILGVPRVMVALEQQVPFRDHLSLMPEVAVAQMPALVVQAVVEMLVRQLALMVQMV